MVTATQKAYNDMRMPIPMLIMRGHMRGATNVFYERLLDEKSGCLKTTEELRERKEIDIILKCSMQRRKGLREVRGFLLSS